VIRSLNNHRPFSVIAIREETDAFAETMSTGSMVDAFCWQPLSADGPVFPVFPRNVH
jgi:hypothetical protein